MGAVNLARKSFANSRPVTRLVTLLWLTGALLFAVNLWSFYGYFSGHSASSARLQKVDQQLASERDRLRQLETEVGNLDLTQRNQMAHFLNAKIAERSFSWSLLFDRLADVLPGKVRLTSLTPKAEDDEARRSRVGSSSDLIELSIRGEAKDTDSMLEFINALFDHEAFVNPNLKRDSLGDGIVGFELEAQYRPSAELPSEANQKTGVGGQP